MVIWEGYPLKKDYTREPIENLYGQEELQTYEKWLKTDNEQLDIQKVERKIACRLTSAKVQNAAADKFRKDDTLSKKASMLKGFYSEST